MSSIKLQSKYIYFQFINEWIDLFIIIVIIHYDYVDNQRYFYILLYNIYIS